MSSLIKISFQEDGRKQERMFEFAPHVTCRLAVEQVSAAFAVPEDWTMALYSKKHAGWIHDSILLMNIVFKGHKSLEMRTKTPAYFEAKYSATLEPSKTSLRDSTILRGPTSPIDPHRLFNFFRTSDDQFVSRFQKGCIYLSIVILNSDNKILLGPSGVPPTVMVSTVGGLANYYSFDTDSADFAWMVKTTLDWASDTPSISYHDPCATPEPRTVTQFVGSAASSIISPPLSRISFSGTNRGSSKNLKNISGVGSRSNVSSISVDRSSVISDVGSQQPVYDYIDRRKDCGRENRLRQDYVDAVDQLQRKLGIPPIDMLFDKVIELTQVGAKSVMAIQYIKDENKNHISPELMHAGSFRWRSIDSISGSVYTRNEEIWPQLTSYHDNIRVTRPTSGLYIGLYYTESTMSGLQILVPKQRRTFIPIVKVRDNSNIAPEEWDWIKSTTSMDLNQLAKACAVSKDDPMHHLKVEFAHSTAKLSRLTQLKWNPSDMYTQDTMRVVYQNIGNVGNNSSLPPTPGEMLTSEDPRPSIIEPPSTPPTVRKSVAAMDVDPIWNCSPLEKEDTNTIRVIMFIKPTRHATQPQEHFNRDLFEMSSFPIFDTLHHSVYNTATYLPLRKSMLSLTNDIVELEQEIEQELEIELELEMGSGGRTRGRRASSAVKLDESDLLGSLLIDELGIKGESPHPLHAHQHPRHRSSFIGDNTINRRTTASRRSSTHSIREAVERSVPSASSVISLASTLSSSSTESPSLVPESGNLSSFLLDGADKFVSDIFLSRSEMSKRRGSRTDSDEGHAMTGSLDRKSQEGHMSFMDMLQDFDPVPSREALGGGEHSNGTSINNLLSLNGDNISNSHNFYFPHGQGPLDENVVVSNGRPMSFGRHSRGDSRQLNPLPYSPKHRRTQSHVQSIDLPPLSNYSSPRNPRSRTTSHSSVYKNRYLSHMSFPHYSPHYQQHTTTATTDNALGIYHHQHGGERGVLSPTATTASVRAAELENLERQQDELQEQWRMASWTRQMNEWDHARTLKGQQELLGISIGLGLDHSNPSPVQSTAFTSFGTLSASPLPMPLPMPSSLSSP
ncbi:Ankyrin-repeat and fibronectin type III domain-containing 1 [Mortierella hygrophila]|uniref:Ankyrin-repeat and fibronectin type III domain-containing 1 n=1 Tax=Mortierella hygrophila TaxID=979708 RepID=A0A9P6EY97_9FUNG|nr:Ankyrin-repeat and fibronectin type III domain-containing 1 [Mortierella hygrophila]